MNGTAGGSTGSTATGVSITVYPGCVSVTVYPVVPVVPVVSDTVASVVLYVANGNPTALHWFPCDVPISILAYYTS